MTCASSSWADERWRPFGAARASGRLSHTLNRGARLEAIELTAAQRTVGRAAARLVGLEVAAVDLLDVAGGPKVFEVNSSPGIAEMERACGVDIATPDHRAGGGPRRGPCPQPGGHVTVGLDARPGVLTIPWSPIAPASYGDLTRARLERGARVCRPATVT